MTFLNTLASIFVVVIFLRAVNWTIWWTISRDRLGSSLFPVQLVKEKKIMKENSIMALQNEWKALTEFKDQFILILITDIFCEEQMNS